MSSCNEPDIKPFSGRDFTCVTFKPDLSKFSMERLDRDIVALMTRRAYDVAGSSNGVKVFLNGKLLPVSECWYYRMRYLMCVSVCVCARVQCVCVCVCVCVCNTNFHICFCHRFVRFVNTSTSI